MRFEAFEEHGRIGWAVVAEGRVLATGSESDPALALFRGGAAFIEALRDRTTVAAPPPPSTDFRGSVEITQEQISVDIPLLDPEEDTQ